jgi:L-ascorbate metabolism protein UlaG (beta-lactamase superfamily)
MRLKMAFLLVPIFFILACFVFYITVNAVWGVPPYHGPKSDHFDGEHFYNPQPTPMHGLGRYLWMRVTAPFKTPAHGSVPAAWPDWIDQPPGPPPPARVSGLRVTWVNHATMLIQIEGVNILTDPIWSERASPVSWAGPRRHRDPGILFEDLPKIDVVILSHNHYDHMDLPTLHRLANTFHPKFVTALGNAAFLKGKGLTADELDWWQDEPGAPGIRLIAVPAKHFSARAMNDRNRALWTGFVIQGAKESVFFAGDTGYGGHFKTIGKRFPKIRVALIPIGAYRPRWFMQPVHLSPEEAVQAQLDLGAEAAIPMHYGTFKLSEEAMEDPVKELREELKRRQPNAPGFVVLAPGEGKDF